jgi:hypothetical protein
LGPVAQFGRAPGAGKAVTVTSRPGTVQTLFVRAIGSYATKRVICFWLGVWVTGVVSVTRRPCESTPITSVDSWVFADPLAIVRVCVTLYVAV